MSYGTLTGNRRSDGDDRLQDLVNLRTDSARFTHLRFQAAPEWVSESVVQQKEQRDAAASGEFAGVAGKARRIWFALA